MSETSYRGLTHACDHPECHVAGFVATLERKDEAQEGDDSPAAVEPTQ